MRVSRYFWNPNLDVIVIKEMHGVCVFQLRVLRNVGAAHSINEALPATDLQRQAASWTATLAFWRRIHDHLLSAPAYRFFLCEAQWRSSALHGPWNRKSELALWWDPSNQHKKCRRLPVWGDWQWRPGALTSAFPNFTPLNYFLWGYVKNYVYAVECSTREEYVTTQMLHNTRVQCYVGGYFELFL